MSPQEPPGLPLAAPWICFGALPSAILLRIVNPDAPPSSGQAGPIRCIFSGIFVVVELWAMAASVSYSGQHLP